MNKKILSIICLLCLICSISVTAFAKSSTLEIGSVWFKSDG